MQKNIKCQVCNHRVNYKSSICNLICLKSVNIMPLWRYENIAVFVLASRLTSDVMREYLFFWQMADGISGGVSKNIIITFAFSKITCSYQTHLKALLKLLPNAFLIQPCVYSLLTFLLTNNLMRNFEFYSQSSTSDMLLSAHKCRSVATYITTCCNAVIFQQLAFRESCAIRDFERNC